eukprot:GHVQ01029845.1.p1 GENE.GHVQ01029845.1~~GHVQ01029845.1.p1  ORF type:complete len:271 (-),score=37.14 GHVQ01029845.1:5-817(-)
MRHMCSQLNVAMLYTTLAKELDTLHDLEFCHQTVQVLNWILLTSQETRAFRKDLARTNDKCLIKSILIPWFHNPVSAIGLCIWVGEYELAYEMTCRVGDIQPSANLLMQVDQLTNLIESPIFAGVRQQLVESHIRPALLKTLLSLAMLLPQSVAAFDILMKRIQIVQTGLLAHQMTVKTDEDNPSTISKRFSSPCEFAELLALLSVTIDRHISFIDYNSASASAGSASSLGGALTVDQILSSSPNEPKKSNNNNNSQPHQQTLQKRFHHD